MITDLSEIRRLAEAESGENTRFRRFLKAHHQSEEPFHILAAEVQQQIDCMQCANCCRELEVPVSAGEIRTLAKHLQTTAGEIVRLYALPDPDEPGSRLLARKDGACVFLDGNLCLVYEARPKACQGFPHSAVPERSLGGRMSSQCRRAAVCPIVFNALEQYKHLTGFRRHEQEET